MIKHIITIALLSVCFVSFAQERILVTAHAGSCGTQANTLESLTMAASLGADLVEMDVRQRPDGIFALKHDAIEEGEEVALLREALLAVKPYNCRINLDIKASCDFQRLYELLVDISMSDRVILTGVHPEDLFKAREQMPTVPYYPSFEPSVELISNGEYAKALISFLKATASEGINCNYSHVTPELTKLLKDNSLKLSVWTVDKESEMKRIISLHPYNITTRHPDTVMAMTK